MRLSKTLIATAILVPACVAARYARPVAGPLQRPIIVGSRLATTEEVANFNKVRADPELMRRAEAGLSSKSTQKKLEVSVDDGGVVDLFTSLTLMDCRPGYRYRWTLNVFDANWKTRFVNHRYDDQIFTVPGEDVERTFAERIVLQPGSYNVEVVLHAIPPTLNPADLTNETVDRAHRVGQCHMPVFISN